MQHQEQVKGAVYFPSRAYNAYQTYADFDTIEINRDFGFAQKAGINALRIFTSYEYWLEEAETFWQKFEALLRAAAAHEIRVMPILFENCGREPTRENARSRDPEKASCIQSPGRAVTSDPEKWDGPLGYVREFMARYADDARLIAIETMNEPHEQTGDLPFARAVTREAYALRGAVPLTIGCIHLHHNLFFEDWLGVYQFHDNFPTGKEEFRAKLNAAACLQEITGKPVWISEWQRLREAGPGWDKAVIPAQEVVPDLASLASEVYGSGIGSFFWSLMVKPAYLPAQRPNGTFNGLFHEDGRVFSARDYRAVSGLENAPEEFPHRPIWFEEDLRRACGGEEGKR